MFWIAFTGLDFLGEGASCQVQIWGDYNANTIAVLRRAGVYRPANRVRNRSHWRELYRLSRVYTQIPWG